MSIQTANDPDPECLKAVIEGIDRAMEKNYGDSLHVKVSSLKKRGEIDYPTSSIGNSLVVLESGVEGVKYTVERFKANQTKWTIK